MRAGGRVARVRLSADERREQLLAVSGRLFAELGFHGLSMEALADAAGVSKPVLYQHFPSKMDLYLALVEDAVEEMETTVRRALIGTTDNRDRVHGAIAAYVAFVEDPRFALVYGTGGPADAEEVRTVVAAATARVAQAIGELIAEDAGLDEPSALLLAAALRGLAMDGARWYAEHPSLDRAEAVRLLSRLAWRGIGGFSS